MRPFRNRHEYGETYAQYEQRARDRADTVHTEDLPGDHEAAYAPVPWWAIDPSFKLAPVPMPSHLLGSRKNPAALSSGHGTPRGGGQDARPAGLGGSRRLAAHPSTKEAA
jgi:hypothetical protein